MDTLMGQGVGFSGHEANCLFLNTAEDKGRFATASVATGFDFLDDSRALGLIDWDQDGDLDVWTSNRTAPQLRFLENQLGNDGRWLAFHLTGKSGHPSGIGARVTVRLKNEAKPLVRTLKCGEGFLGQNSAWLHFGLGLAQAGEIAQVEVRWPRGKRELFQGVSGSGAYFLTESTGQAIPAKRPVVSLKTLPNTNLPAPLDLDGPVILNGQQIMPPLPTHNAASIFFKGPGRSLLHWWNPDDDAANAQLAVVEKFAATLPAGQAQVHFINAQPTARKPALGSLGLATEETKRRLVLLNHQLFGAKLPPPPSCTFVISETGILLGLARGQVSQEKLASLWATNPAKAEPLFPGYWVKPPEMLNPLTVPGELAEAGFPEEGFALMQQHEALVTRRVGFQPVLMAFAASAEQKGKFPAALDAYAMILRHDGKFLPALNNLAWHLAACPDAQLRHPEQAYAMATAAVAQNGGQTADLLDTLGTTCLATNRLAEARTAWQKALALTTSGHPLRAELEKKLQQLP